MNLNWHINGFEIFKCICVNVNIAKNGLIFSVFSGRLVFKSEGELIWFKHSGLVFALMFLQSQHLLSVWVLPLGRSVQLYKRQKLICGFFSSSPASITVADVCFEPNVWSKYYIFIYQTCISAVIFAASLPCNAFCGCIRYLKWHFCVCVCVDMFVFFHMYVCITYLCVWGLNHNRSSIIVKRHWFS